MNKYNRNYIGDYFIFNKNIKDPIHFLNIIYVIGLYDDKIEYLHFNVLEHIITRII
jgi:hypothetical protein